MREPFTRTEKILLAALVVSVVVAVLIPSAFWLSEREQDRARDASQLRARASACAEFNVQAQRQRDGEKAQIRSVITDRERTAEEQARVDEILARHDAQVDESYLDRDCSPEGIDAYIDGDPATDPYVRQ